MQTHPRVALSLEEAAAAFQGSATKDNIQEPLVQQQELVDVKRVLEKPSKKPKKFAFPTPGASGFPDASAVASADPKSLAFPSKSSTKSIFASMLSSSGGSSEKEKRDAETVSVSEERSGTTQQVSPDGSEFEGIHEENVRRLETMTQKEIDEARQEVLGRFDPEVLQGLMTKRGKASSKKQRKKQEQDDVETPKDLGWIRSDEDLKSALKTKLPAREQLKVRWMLEDENVDTATGDDSSNKVETTEPRFDLQGEFITSESEYKNELYHHGGPNVPGYTIDELVHLSRSTVATQRALALRALAGLFRKRAENLSKYSQATLLQDEALLSLRIALDHENSTSLPLAVEALHSYLMPPATLEQDKTFALTLGIGYRQWGVIPRAQGSPTTPPAAAREIAMDAAEVEEEENKEETRLNDRELAEASPVRFLLRTGIIQRVAFLLGLPETPFGVQQRLIEISTFIVRSYPFVMSKEFDGLDRIVSRLKPLPSGDVPPITDAVLDLVAAVIASSKSAATMVADKWMSSILTLILKRDGESHSSKTMLKTKARVMYSLRSLCAYGLLVDAFEMVMPLWAPTLEDYLEMAGSGNDSTTTDGIAFSCAFFDLAYAYCVAKQKPSEVREKVFQRVSGFASIAMRIAATMFSVPGVGTRVASAAVRFLSSFVGLKTERDEEITSEEWSLSLPSIVSSSRTKSNNPQSQESERNDESQAEQDPPELTMSYMAGVIFAGHAVYLMENLEGPRTKEVDAAALDALKSSVMLLKSFCKLPHPIGTRYAQEMIESSTLVEDLWRISRTFRSSFLLSQSTAATMSKPRAMMKPPQSPLLGVIYLELDNLFKEVLGLLVCTAPFLKDSQSNELRELNASTFVNTIVEHIGEKAAFGPVGNEETTWSLISALLSPGFILFPTSKHALEARELLLPKFEMLLFQSAPQEESLLMCRRDDVYQRFVKAGRAWPALPLITLATITTANPPSTGPAASLKLPVALSSLDFCLGLREFIPPNLVVGILCHFCIGSSREVLLDEDVTLKSCKWWDWALDKRSSSQVTSPSVFESIMRFARTKDRLRQLSAELSEKYVEDCFGNVMIGRCLSVLVLSRDVPVEVRAAGWKVLDRGRGLQQLNDSVVHKSLVENVSDEVEEMFELMVTSIESGSINTGDWIFTDYVLPRLRVLFSPENSSRWISRRLRNKLESSRPDLVLF